MSRAMGSHHSHRAGSTTWLTPIGIIDALGGQPSFDLDPCGHPEWPTARRSISLPSDGLAEPWRGRVWLNPPYGQEAWNWLDKLAQHGTGTALLFARTETAGFCEQVWAKADALLFLAGRLHFHQIKPYPCGPEPDHHNHKGDPAPSGGHYVVRVDGKESECPDCTEPVPAEGGE